MTVIRRVSTILYRPCRNGAGESEGEVVVLKFFRRFAGLSLSVAPDETIRQKRPEPVGKPIPSAWIKMNVWRRDQGRCVLCGGQERVWFEYIVPVWEGGRVTEQNIRLLCGHCNSRNKDSSVRIWRKNRSA